MKATESLHSSINSHWPWDCLLFELARKRIYWYWLKQARIPFSQWRESLQLPPARGWKGVSRPREFKRSVKTVWGSPYPWISSCWAQPRQLRHRHCFHIQQNSKARHWKHSLEMWHHWFRLSKTLSSEKVKYPWLFLFITEHKSPLALVKQLV